MLEIGDCFEHGSEHCRESVTMKESQEKRRQRMEQERKRILQKKGELVRSEDHYLLPRGQGVY